MLQGMLVRPFLMWRMGQGKDGRPQAERAQQVPGQGSGRGQPVALYQQYAQQLATQPEQAVNV
jgi:hypothetical protein